MNITLKASAGLAALSFVLAGCMSAPTPAPRLLAAEASLQRAMSDPTTLESGRASLEKAGIALQDARTAFMKRENDEYLHALRMGEGYVELAGARGDQVLANRKIASLNKDRADFVSQTRARELNAAQADTAAAQATASAAVSAAADSEARARASDRIAAGAVADEAAARTAQLAAEARTSAALAELASYEQKQTELGLTLIMRDLQFASASAVLSRGAEGRLAPLAAFLARQPDARIQIAGHTDSQGSDAANMHLSTRRADSVRDHLYSTGVARARITTIGSGESMPVATNDTAAGRAINRRVEVTILN